MLSLGISSRVLNAALSLALLAGLIFAAYLYGYERGARPLRERLQQQEQAYKQLEERYKKAAKSVDNLINQLENKPLPEAPRVKETIRYIRVQEPADNQCLNPDTVRMLNNIRSIRGTADAVAASPHPPTTGSLTTPSK